MVILPAIFRQGRETIVDKVRCKDCGYLSIRDHITSESRTADEVSREVGKASFPEGRGYMKHSVKFLCHLGSPAFASEKFEHIQNEITCDSFTPWIPAKTPKEHEEMSIVEKVKAEHEAARQDDLQLMATWRHEDAERFRIFEENANLRHEEMLAAEVVRDAALDAREKWNSLRSWISVVAAVISTAAAVAAAIAALKSTG